VRESVAQPTEFTVPVARQQQIGVTYATIEKRPFTHAIRAVGVVAYDKQRIGIMSAALKVTCKSSSYSRAVSWSRRKAPILTIYSPDLLTHAKRVRGRAQDAR